MQISRWPAIAMAAFISLHGACSLAEQPAALINPVGTNIDTSAMLQQDASVDDVLDALQTRGKDLKEFVADVKLTETDTIMSNSNTRSGKIWLQLKPGGDPRLHIIFDKKADGDKPPVDEKKEYLLNDGWVVDRDYRAKNEVNRQINRPGEKVNLFQLGKGPFPLPIGQDKKEVHSSFDVTKIAMAKDDPASSVHLQLKPKPESEFARRFSKIDVWVDLKTRMPIRIETLDRNQTTDRQTDLENIKVNPMPGLKDDDFSIPPIDKAGWNRHDEPYGN